MSSLAGSFLVARAVLQDPNFAQTVVFLLQHAGEGAFGLVVNRPAEVADLPFPVCSGGPCPSPGLLMLHGHPEWAQAAEEESVGELAPGIFLGDAACVERVSEPSPGQTLRYRIFTGYAGWGPGQLEAELAAGAWSVAQANGQVLFDTPLEELWDSLSPPALPQPSLN